MLPISQVEAVASLLSRGGLSRREIAERTGVSRGTVNAIANGERDLKGRPPVEHLGPGEALAESVRCPGCGGKIYVVPCVACFAARYRGHEAAFPASV